MHLLMISGDRSVLQNKRSAFWYTLEEFSKHWDRISIICPQSWSDADGLPVSATRFELPAHITFYPSPYLLCWQPWWILQCGQRIHAQNPCDVMTVQEYPPFYNGLGARWLHEVTGLPYVLEIHHVVGYPKPASWSERIGRWLSWVYLRCDVGHARKVRVVNGNTATLLETWGVPKEKISIIPSFYLDTDLLKSGSAPPIAYDFVCTARLVRNKGIKHVIEATSRIPGCRLLVIGDGPDRKRLEKYVHNLKLDGSVTFTGWLPTQRDVLEAMRSSRMFVMSSSSEGGPRSLLEAMSCGLPVISTQVGVASDVIRHGENGLLYDGTADDLIQKAQYLLQNETVRQNMGKAAVNVMEKFERSAAIAVYAHFLQSVL